MVYLKYWIPVLVLAVNYAGIAAGGYWVWAGIGTVPLLALLDSLLPLDYRVSKIELPSMALLPIWVCIPAVPMLFVFASWQAGTQGFTAWQSVGVLLSLGWTCIIPLVPAVHELFHMRNKVARFFGRLGMLCVLDTCRDVPHVVGHHTEACLPQDNDTAVRGQSVYAFTAGALIGNTRYALQNEAKALKARGHSPWNFRHRAYQSLLTVLAFNGVLYAVGGWQGLALGATAQVVGRLFLEAINYLQHYGLVRAEGQKVGRRHSWNHLRWLSRTATFEITTHADHHLNSYQPYYKLVPHREGMVLPSVFLLAMIMLIPPLWVRFFRPYLEKWDLEYANDEEREIVRKQNAELGWPDWSSRAAPANERPSTVGI